MSSFELSLGSAGKFSLFELRVVAFFTRLDALGERSGRTSGSDESLLSGFGVVGLEWSEISISSTLLEFCQTPVCNGGGFIGPKLGDGVVLASR